MGKTSVAVALARELVRRGRRTGLLDADLHGPDVPRMLGIRRDRRARSVTLTATKGERNAELEAVDVDGLKVASVGFLLGGDQGLTMAGPFAELHARPAGEADRLGRAGRARRRPPARHRGGPAGPARAVRRPDRAAGGDPGRGLAPGHRPGRGRAAAGRGPAARRRGEHGPPDLPALREPSPLHTPAPVDRTIWAQGVPKLASVPFRTDGVVTAADIGPVADAAEARMAS